MLSRGGKACGMGAASRLDGVLDILLWCFGVFLVCISLHMSLW